MSLETQYMRFVLADEQKPKTQVWNVEDVHDGAILGVIRWYGPWRQYCFFPDQSGEPDSLIFSDGCLVDLQSFLKKLMDERRKK